MKRFKKSGQKRGQVRGGASSSSTLEYFFCSSKFVSFLRHLLILLTQLVNEPFLISTFRYQTFYIYQFRVCLQSGHHCNLSDMYVTRVHSSNKANQRASLYLHAALSTISQVSISCLSGNYFNLSVTSSTLVYIHLTKLTNETVFINILSCQTFHNYPFSVYILCSNYFSLPVTSLTLVSFILRK